MYLTHPWSYSLCCGPECAGSFDPADADGRISGSAQRTSTSTTPAEGLTSTNYLVQDGMRQAKIDRGASCALIAIDQQPVQRG